MMPCAKACATAETTSGITRSGTEASLLSLEDSLYSCSTRFLAVKNESWASCVRLRKASFFGPVLNCSIDAMRPGVTKAPSSRAREKALRRDSASSL